MPDRTSSSELGESFFLQLHSFPFPEALATFLRFNQEHAGLHAFLLHGPGERQALRATAVHALLRGDRDAFLTVCSAGNAWRSAVAPLTGAELETPATYFDAHELALEQQLGEVATGLAALRAELRLARTAAQPQLDEVTLCLGADEISGVSALGQRIEPMLSTKRFSASFDGESAGLHESRRLELEAPGLPAGVPFVVQLEEASGALSLELTGLSAKESVAVEFSDWHLSRASQPLELAAGEAFPHLRYRFAVRVAGRTVRSRNAVTYSDRVELLVKLGETDCLSGESYVICTPWGTRTGTTDERGWLREEGLPPGGVSIALRGRILLQDGTLDYGWDLDG